MEQSYGDWIRSNPPRPTKRYKKEHMAQQKQNGDTNKMVTAVEWLADKLMSELWTDTECKKFIEHALEMNKQQHGNTWDSAIKAHDERGHVHARSLVDFDEYYNDTFKH